MRQMYIILSYVGWGCFAVAISYLLFRLSRTDEREITPYVWVRPDEER